MPDGSYRSERADRDAVRLDKAERAIFAALKAVRECQDAGLEGYVTDAPDLLTDAQAQLCAGIRRHQEEHATPDDTTAMRRWHNARTL